MQLLQVQPPKNKTASYAYVLYSRTDQTTRECLHNLHWKDNYTRVCLKCAISSDENLGRIWEGGYHFPGHYTLTQLAYSETAVRQHYVHLLYIGK